MQLREFFAQVNEALEAFAQKRRGRVRNVVDEGAHVVPLFANKHVHELHVLLFVAESAKTFWVAISDETKIKAVAKSPPVQFTLTAVRMLKLQVIKSKRGC